jgi:glucokinase
MGIGIADVGPVNRKTGVSVISSQMEFWRNVPLGPMFEEEFGVPIYLENATRCRGNAERLIGAGNNSDDMIYVEYGAGIGSAIIAGGRSLEGRHSSAGEFGHTRVASDGLPCKCGSFGCLEAMAGPAALANRFREIAIDGSSSLALTLAGGDRHALTGWHVLEASREGDKISSVIVEELIRHLALGLGNAVNLLDPSCIVLDGRLGICGDGFLAQLQRAVRMQGLSHITCDLAIVYGKLREEAGVLGAALMVLEEVFSIPELKPPHFLLEPDAVESTLR